MKLVIVESPAKSKTIAQYLGEDFRVEASVGHVRDLSIGGKGGLGVDIENDFAAKYSINKEKVSVVAKLKKLAKSADEVILATDPDREGEAIAWHLASVLNLDIESTKRLEFHEITKTSILEAMDDPHLINMDLVHSQEARRIIDRILGFKLSNLLRNRIKSNSAGRVQSVALRLIVDHEKEINDFISEIYYVIEASILKDNQKYKIELSKVDGKTPELKSEERANYVLTSLGKTCQVSDINVSKKTLESKEPFRTSTLQQQAYSKFGYSIKETTVLAQQLYEGIELGGELVGLVTYIRTDSTKLSEGFVKSAQDYIIANYGADYYKGAKKSKNVKNSQDAHEAIRPTSLERTPASVKAQLAPKAYKLYKLIYERTLSSLMTSKIVETTSFVLTSNNIAFTTKTSKVLFPGYDIFKLDEEEESSLIPSLKIGDSFELVDVSSKQEETKPPARYSEGKFVKIMEENGIGRPSTYSSTIQTLVQRKYVTSTKGVLAPTEQGVLTSTVLVKYFAEMMNTDYTAELETSLDKIQNGEVSELDVMKNFYSDFEKIFNEAKDKMYKEPLKKTGEKCPVCGNDLVERIGRYGKFISCSDYPNCKYIAKTPKEAPVEVGRNCPDCGHPLVYRKNKKGQQFIGCSNFPKCRYIETDQTNQVEEEKKYCPDCGQLLVRRKGKIGYFYGCSGYPKCKHIEPIKDEK